MNRARAAKAAADVGHPSTAESRKAQEIAKNAVQCQVCMTGFPRTVKSAELHLHFDAKHSKSGKSFAEAFPTFNDDDDDDS